MMARPGVPDLLRRPVVVAPMAGGPSTPGLVIAAASAGALGFLAAGYKTPEAMAAEISAVRAATSEPFGVNVFVPGAPCADTDALGRYLSTLRTAGPTGDASWDDDGFDGKVAALLADPPPVISFTFGCPPAEVISALQDAGSTVVVTVTSPGEAVLAAAAGADGLCVQGYEAGAPPGDVRERRRARARLRPADADRRGGRGDRPAADRGRRHHGPAPGPGRDRGRGGGRAVRHGLPALSRERRAPAVQGGAGRPAVHGDQR